MHSTWFSSTFLRFLKFPQIKDGEPNFLGLGNNSAEQLNYKKLNFMIPFYGWGSTAPKLEPLWAGSLLFTTKFPEIPGTHFIDLRTMKDWVDLGAAQCFWTRDPWIWNPALQPLDHCSICSPFGFSIKEIWRTQFLHHSLDFSAFYVIQQYFSKVFQIFSN